MKLLPLQLAVVFSALCSIALHAADSAEDSKQWFRDAAAKMEAKQFAEAVPLLEKVRAVVPNDGSVEWNLGLAYTETARHEEALACWETMQKLEPGNWQATAKVVQALQALGRNEARDRAIEQVRAEQKAGSDPRLARAPWFCREQFKVDDFKVLAIEYFNPAGPRAVFTAFSVVDSVGKEVCRYSLGSYDATNDVARATKEVGPDERLYHLDYNGREQGAQTHRTYGFFKQRPDYETLRERVVKAIKAEITPISSTTSPAKVAGEK